MPVVTHQPLVLKDVLLQLGSNNYENAVSNVTFTPTAPSVSWQGLTPSASFTDVGTASWAVSLTFAQDWDTPKSLSEFLFDNEGQTISATFRPKSGGGSTFTVQLVITPGAIGGAVNAVAEVTVSLGAKGRPVRVPGAPTVPAILSASPATGSTAGGTLVQITGSRFTGTTGATGVKFGSANATSYTVVSDGLIVAVAPAQAAGSKPVTVTNATGVSTTTGAYTYA